jgi:hypothetical protein
VIRDLMLYRVPGEDRAEIVFFRSWGEFGLWVKHEYTSAPCWEWILVHGRDPIAFGDEATREDAERELAAAVEQFCPGFKLGAGDGNGGDPPGLLRRLIRAFGPQ